MQNFNKMQWYNEPESWEITGNNLIMKATPCSGYWRHTGCGYAIDDAPFYYALYGGDFEVTVKLTGRYTAQHNWAGLMLRTSHLDWIAAGVELSGSRFNISTVVTHAYSDRSMLPLDSIPHSVWMRAVRKSDSVEISYSADGENYTVVRLAYLPPDEPVMAGLAAASPEGEGFAVLFEKFNISRLSPVR